MAHLEINDLSVTYERGTDREARALDGVHLSIGRGEIVFLVGPNGCGKTTLFRAIMGQCACEGELRLGAVRLEGMPTHKRANLIAYWPQHVESILPDALTLLEVFALGVRRMSRKRLALVSKRVRAEAQMMIDEAVLPLDGKLDDLVIRLSGGQMSAALLLITFGRGCPLIMMDEPTSALDKSRRAALEEYIICTARAKGETVLWVTHDLGRALESGDRIVVLVQGRVAADIRRDSELWDASKISGAMRRDG